MVKYYCLVLLLVAFSQANMITSPAVTSWGTWEGWESCPYGKFAQGFQLKFETWQGGDKDDTALNAIRLYCGEPSKPETPVITSFEGDRGNWDRKFSCFPGYLYGFQLRSESDCGPADDTGANNIRFWCSTSEDPNQYMEGTSVHGTSWGDWTQPKRCNKDQAISGIRTQVQSPHQSNGDNTSLNNVAFICGTPVPEEKSVQPSINVVLQIPPFLRTTKYLDVQQERDFA